MLLTQVVRALVDNRLGPRQCKEGKSPGGGGRGEAQGNGSKRTAS